MRRPLLATLAPVFALAALVAANPTHAAGAAGRSFATYYGCPSGYEFQAQGSAARCYRPSRVETTALVPCPNVTVPVVNTSVGLFAQVDFNGNKDMCAAQGVAGVSAQDRVCPPGYTEREVSGADRCERTVPADIKAPTVPVSV
jgi:hypothetical protein